MLCVMCGQKIDKRGIYQTDARKNHWCEDCTKRVLSKWYEFEKLEKLVESTELYRNALVDTLKWSIKEGYCVRPREQCRASPERCLGCWLLFLVGETEG